MNIDQKPQGTEVALDATVLNNLADTSTAVITFDNHVTLYDWVDLYLYIGGTGAANKYLGVRHAISADAGSNYGDYANSDVLPAISFTSGSTVKYSKRRIPVSLYNYFHVKNMTGSALAASAHVARVVGGWIRGSNV